MNDMKFNLNFDDYADILTVQDLCHLLHISRGSAYRLIKGNILHARRIGRQYRILKSEVIHLFRE